MPADANRTTDTQRKHESLLAASEKKALVWMAERLPAWVNSDHLTVLGFLAMLGVGLSYWYARLNRIGLVLASILLVVNWFGDSLDGTVARVRNKLRPKYGFYVDHMVDTFGTLFLFGGLGLSGYMSMRVAACVLIVYFMLSIEVYLATYSIGVFKLSHFHFGPTELRLLLIAGNIAVWFKPIVNIRGHYLPMFDVGGMCAVAGLGIVLIRATIQHTIELYRRETVE